MKRANGAQMTDINHAEVAESRLEHADNNYTSYEETTAVMLSVIAHALLAIHDDLRKIREATLGVATASWQGERR